MKFETHFNPKDLTLLFIGAVFIIISLLLFRQGRTWLSIAILLIAAIFLRFFVVNLDPFLYPWDEQFHALVAKNMLTHPFTPMLYTNPVLPYDMANWTGNHIWLHKEPLFLWIIAISFKIFGINEMALRLPSILMSSILVPVLYRIGKILVNEKMGYCTAFIFALANYQIEMVTGIIGMDHNDVSFMFFIALSFWAWFEYQSSNNKKWLYLIGVFSGMAVLVKWIMGFIVFFCWGITMIFNKENRKTKGYYKDILKSFLCSLIVAIPWQVYIFLKFPKEALSTYLSYTSHFSSGMDGHTGSGYYYLDLIGKQYGWIVPFVLIPSFYYLYKKIKVKKNELIVIISWILSVNIFFAIAKTKLPLFTIICCPVIFLALGNFLSISIEYIEAQTKKLSALLIWILLILVGYSNINLLEIESRHKEVGDEKVKRELFLNNTHVFKKADSLLRGIDCVVFNCKNFNAILMMFYSNHTAYAGIPDSNTFVELKNDKIKMAVFNDSKLPDYIMKDTGTIKLDLKIIYY
ncbi:MAG: ArnT family glycosyltransferase [Bacteroidia bacterium]